MKTTYCALAGLALLVSAPASFAQAKAPEAPPAAKSVNEEGYAKTILGSWKLEMKEGPVVGQAISTYEKDGTCTTAGSFTAEGQKLEAKAKGKWTIVKDKITIEVTESSAPEMIPVGQKSTDTILSLTDKEYRYRNASGEEMKETRVVVEKAKAATK